MIFANGGPASAKNILETAKSSGQFAIFLKAAAAAGLDKTLEEPGPYTLFAPSDEAFNALPPGTLDRLMKPENKDELKKMLGNHVMFGLLTTKDLKDDKSFAPSTIGQPIVLEKKDGAVMANDAKIVQPDLKADNGVIEVIDKVLVPAKPVQPKT